MLFGDLTITVVEPGTRVTNWSVRRTEVVETGEMVLDHERMVLYCTPTDRVWLDAHPNVRDQLALPVANSNTPPEVSDAGDS